MSVNQFFIDQRKPWLSGRVENWTVDGNLTINGSITPPSDSFPQAIEALTGTLAIIALADQEIQFAASENGDYTSGAYSPVDRDVTLPEDAFYDISAKLTCQFNGAFNNFQTVRIHLETRGGQLLSSYNMYTNSNDIITFPVQYTGLLAAGEKVFVRFFCDPTINGGPCSVDNVGSTRLEVVKLAPSP